MVSVVRVGRRGWYKFALLSLSREDLAKTSKKMKNVILLSSLAIVASFSPPTVGPYVARIPLRAASDMPPLVGELNPQGSVYWWE